MRFSSTLSLAKRWQQNYLKDLYHRRMIVGAEPLTHRSAMANWNYVSELYAFRHRLHGEDKENEHFIKALTNPTFFTRKDVAGDASFAQPSLEEEIESREDNAQLASDGDAILHNIVNGYFSLQFPDAPMEFVEALTGFLTNDQILAEAASSLGMQHLIRTGEFPPSNSSLADSFKACLIILSPERRQLAILETLVAKAVSIPLEDVLPFRNPLSIVEAYAKKHLKAEKVEPRLMHKSGENSPTPLYYVGVYADQDLIRECAGESLSVAVDLASQASLLHLWGASPDMVLVNVAFNEHDLSKVPKNHSIYHVVSKEYAQMADQELKNLIKEAQTFLDSNDELIKPNFLQGLRSKLDLPESSDDDIEYNLQSLRDLLTTATKNAEYHRDGKKFIGKWDLDSSENVGEYLKAVGVGLLTRKQYTILKPQVVIAVDGDHWRMESNSRLMKNTVVEFDLGVEFE